MSLGNSRTKLSAHELKGRPTDLCDPIELPAEQDTHRDNYVCLEVLPVQDHFFCALDPDLFGSAH